MALEPECDIQMFETASCSGAKISIERCLEAARRASATEYADGYSPDAWIPGSRWALCDFPSTRPDAKPFVAHRSLALLRLGDDVMEAVRALPCIESGDRRLEAPDAAIEAAVQAIRGCSELEVFALRFLRRSRRSCRWPTITQSRAEAKQIGLHIDSNSKAALSQRNAVGNRICFNLGNQDRYLLFLGLSLERMLKRAGTKNDLERDAPRFVDRFLAREECIPIFRLRVPPSHAYVAPTECLVHDGATAPDVEDDIAMFIGHMEVL
jgi:hypothetical protein